MAHSRPSVPCVSSVSLRTLTTVLAFTVLSLGPLVSAVTAEEADGAGAHTPIALTVPFELPEAAAPQLSTSEHRLPWLTAEDYEFRSSRSSWWNQRFRPGAGSLSLDASFRRYMPVTRLEDEDDEKFPYFHEADALISTVSLRAAGIVWPGVEVALVGGVGQLQLKPDGDDAYDRYEIGYHFGVEATGALSLRRLGLLAVETAFWTQEFRSEEGNNEAVILNLGEEVVYRTYHFRVAGHFFVEILGNPDDVTLGLAIGGGYEFLYGHFQTLTRENFRLSGHQDFFALAGLTVAVRHSFAGQLEATLTRRDGFGFRLRLSHYFR